MSDKLQAGLIGGLAGGAVFGVLLAFSGLLTMPAAILNSDSPTIGFTIHLIVSAILGMLFPFIFGKMARSINGGALWGLIYGLVMWLVVGMLLMPLLTGASVSFSPAAIMSSAGLTMLGGFSVFGLILGIIYAGMTENESATAMNSMPEIPVTPTSDATTAEPAPLPDLGSNNDEGSPASEPVDMAGSGPDNTTGNNDQDQV